MTGRCLMPHNYHLTLHFWLLDSLAEGHLHHRMMWFSVNQELWPLVKYDLCCSMMATLPELEKVLLPFYGKMLPLGGIVRKANHSIWQLDHGFYGAGFQHPGVEATVEQSNKLLMHMDVIQPWVLSCKHCWTSMWQTWGYHSNLFKFSMSITENGWQLPGWVLSVHNLLVTFPWEGDDWLMARFIAVGCSEKELQRLTRVRIHQQVLFLSDILGASGGMVDKQYLQKQWRGELWSSMKFPHKDVTELEMGLWCAKP